MNWAICSHNWSASACPWLPEKGPGEGYKEGERPDSQWFAEFKQRHYWRRALRHMPEGWSDVEFQQAQSDYEYYSDIST